MPMKISDFIEVSQLGTIKNYHDAETGPGFVVPGEPPIVSLSPEVSAAYVALLNFAEDVPRGNHYHCRKIEYMTVLNGTLFCDFFLVDDPSQKMSLVLEAGQSVRIQPGCVHTFTAKGGDVFALELSPQHLDLSDVVTMD